MKIQNVTDASFRKYGKIITEYSFEKILKEMEHTPLPKDVVYVPSVEELEVLPEAAEICKKGFRCVVVLPKGTNEALPFETAEEGENRLLAAMNKWLIAHEDAQIEGAFCGLKGENVEV